MDPLLCLQKTRDSTYKIGPQCIFLGAIFALIKGQELQVNVLLVFYWLKRVQGPKKLAESQHTVAIEPHHMPL